MTNFSHNDEIGMITSIIGIISAVGNIFILAILNPLASINTPPVALKSRIISGVVNGTITCASEKITIKIINCGTAIKLTTAPKLAPKMKAQKKSRIDFEIKIVASPLIPSVKVPYIPVPLAQNRTIIVTKVVSNNS